MKTSSLPNLNRETTSFPNFASYQDRNHHDDTTLDERPNIDHSEDTEASETLPFKYNLSKYISLFVCIYLFLFLFLLSDPCGRTFPNFFLLLEQPDHHDTTTFKRRRKVDHGEDTEASETSPFKDIISPFVSFVEMNNNHYPVGGSFYEWDEMDQTLPRRPPSPNESVGSNQFSGNVGACTEGPNFTQFRRDRGNLDFPEDKFRRAFKMCKSTFNLNCTQPESIVDDKDMMFQLALPFTPAIIQGVAVCIWYLATGEPLRLISKRFGLDISSCHEFLLYLCYAIENVLLSQYVNWPDDEEKIKVIKSEFESLCGIPNVGGSMYTIRVPVGAPDLNGHAYSNRRRARTPNLPSRSNETYSNETLPSRSLRTPFLVALPPNSPSSYFRFCNQKMKASSLPNLNRNTTSFPNFFTLFQDPNNLDDTTLNKHPNIDHSQDTEPSETSPFKDIPSPLVSFNEMNENHYPVGGSFYEWDWDQMDQTLPRWPPSPNGSDTIVSVGSNQFSSNDRARMEEVWTTIASNLIDDGHAWRKYGQKDMLNAKYPRSYFRCAHKFDQGCLATKQVQKTDEDPPMYQTTYFRSHTCGNPPAPHLIRESVPLDANC